MAKKALLANDTSPGLRQENSACVLLPNWTLGRQLQWVRQMCLVVSLGGWPWLLALRIPAPRHRDHTNLHRPPKARSWIGVGEVSDPGKHPGKRIKHTKRTSADTSEGSLGRNRMIYGGMAPVALQMT